MTNRPRKKAVPMNQNSLAMHSDNAHHTARIVRSVSIGVCAVIAMIVAIVGAFNGCGRKPEPPPLAQQALELALNKAHCLVLAEREGMIVDLRKRSCQNSVGKVGGLWMCYKVIGLGTTFKDYKDCLVYPKLGFGK